MMIMIKTTKTISTTLTGLSNLGIRFISTRFTNTMDEFIRQSHASEQKRIHLECVRKLKEKQPLIAGWSDDDVWKLYNDSFAVRQGMIGNTGIGGWWERCIENILMDNQIPYKTQVFIDASGFVCGSCLGTRVDIVVGDVVLGKHISELTVISTKTSSKDRWKEDWWTLTHMPKLYVLAVINDEYPPPKTFQESSSRKILSINPKRKDTRQFKLTCESLIEELRRFL
jgi:hypothetical protein